MKCPSCQASDTKVIDSRPLLEGSTIRRRRKCDICQNRFTTHEKMQVQFPMIIKSDGRRENYNRDKILQGLKKACQKRPISIEKIDAMLGTLEKFFEESNLKEIAADKIGQNIMQQLLELDSVAYVRFASFYWNFEDIQSFIKELNKNITLS